MWETVTARWQHYLVLLWHATIGMRMTVKTEQLLQDGGPPEYVYHDRTAWHCAVFVGRRYGSKGYPQRNAAHVWWTSPQKGGQEDGHWVGSPVEIVTLATLQRVGRHHPSRQEGHHRHMEITLKNKCLYVIIPIHFFSITICNLLIDFPSYKINVSCSVVTY